MIYITKNGLKRTEWSGDDQQYIETPIRNSFHVLREGCAIEQDVTLGDIIRMVAKDRALNVFVGEYSWADVDAFNAELDRPFVKKSDIDYIEISRHVEIWGAHRSLAERIEDCIDVHGVGKDDKGELQSNWTIEFVPVNEMAHVPVRLAPKMSIYDYRDEAADRTVADAESPGFTLLEVLCEIFYEISFHGSPSQRSDKFGELMEAVEEIKNGTARTIPFKHSDDRVQ